MLFFVHIFLYICELFPERMKKINLIELIHNQNNIPGNKGDDGCTIMIEI